MKDASSLIPEIEATVPMSTAQAAVEQDHVAWLLRMKQPGSPPEIISLFDWQRQARAVILGTAADCDVIIEGAGAAHHAEVFFDGKERCFWIRDLESPHGTLVRPPDQDGYRPLCSGDTRLLDGTRIRLGTSRATLLFRSMR